MCASSSTTAASRRLGLHAPTCRRPVRTAGRSARRRDGCRISRAQRPLRSGSGRCGGLQLGHSGSVRPTAATMSKEAYAELNAPVLGERADAEFARVRRGCAYLGLFDLGLDHDLQGQRELEAGQGAAPARLLCRGLPRSAIGELFGTLSRFDQTISDPCSNDSTAPRNYLQRYRRHRPTASRTACPPARATSRRTADFGHAVGGNEGLKPETSKSWVFGGVFSPAILPGFSIEYNHYDIKIQDAIQAFAADVTVTNCEYSNDPTACALVTRSGQRAADPGPGILQNIAGIRTKGSDLNISYRTRGPTGARSASPGTTPGFTVRRAPADGDRNPGDPTARHGEGSPSRPSRSASRSASSTGIWATSARRSPAATSRSCARATAT